MNKENFFLHDRLNDAQIEKFKLFEDEELIFACREHWLTLIFRLMRKGFLLVVLTIVVASVSYFLFQSITLTMGAVLLILSVVGVAAIRDLIHWSFHLYIATTKQIIEVHYSPLFSQGVNSVLLDQIRCTEIDVEMYGIIPELIGIGNVELTFDRPTHKEQFILKGIRSPRVVASMLSTQLHQGIAGKTSIGQVQQPIWVKDGDENRYKFLGETQYGFTIK